MELSSAAIFVSCKPSPVSPHHLRDPRSHLGRPIAPVDTLAGTLARKAARPAFTALVGDASFACPALQIEQQAAQRVPTYAYEFNDDNAPQLFTPPGFVPPVATHESELPYLLDLPNAPFPPQFSTGQQALAASMRAAWAHFAATGTPATRALPWPAFRAGSARMLSLVPPQPQSETDFATRHHCAFWAAG